MVASPVPPTGDLAHNPGVCPDWESNGIESTEPHQPGPTDLHFTTTTQEVLVSSKTQMITFESFPAPFLKYLEEVNWQKRAKRQKNRKKSNLRI